MATKIISVLLWAPVSLAKAVLVVLGLPVVYFGLKAGKVPSLWRKGHNRPNTWAELAIRNPVGGFGYLIDHPEAFIEWGEILEPHKTDKRFQIRFRQAKLLSSVRFVVKYTNTKYGEVYWGWKLGSWQATKNKYKDETLPELDFAMSIRPFATVGK